MEKEERQLLDRIAAALVGRGFLRVYHEKDLFAKPPSYQTKAEDMAGRIVTISGRSLEAILSLLGISDQPAALRSA